MILQSFLIYVPALIAGFGLAHLVWQDDRPAALLLKLFSGIGLGLGITSCLYFLRLVILPGQDGYLLIQFGFLLGIMIALLLRKRIFIPSSLTALYPTRIGALLGLVVVLVGTIAVYYLITFARIAPHGDYDAQAIWNLRARFMYRSGNAWEAAFSPLINRNFHMDYPLLIPTSVVGGWNTLGGEVLRVPAVLSILFLLGMAGVLYSTIALLRSGSQAAIAALVLLATPGLLIFSAFQTADIPLTYFFLAAASLLVLAVNENNRSLFFLSGMMAGLSAWTKNEGIPFIALLLVFAVFVFGLRQARLHILSLLAGMAFPVLTIFVFKSLISVHNDLFTNNGLPEIIGKILDPTRYLQILTHLTGELVHLGNWPISILAILIAYGWIVGLRTPKHFVEKALWIVPASQLLIYLFVYVVTPHDLRWHMNYSMSRLLIHLFPLSLFAYFLVANTPENVLNKVK
jgi:hypothetical protein